MTRRPSSKILRDLLEGSFGQCSLTVDQALLKRVDFKLTRADKLVYINLAMFKRFESRLGSDLACVSLSRRTFELLFLVPHLLTLSAIAFDRWTTLSFLAPFWLGRMAVVRCHASATSMDGEDEWHKTKRELDNINPNPNPMSCNRELKVRYIK